MCLYLNSICGLTFIKNTSCGPGIQYVAFNNYLLMVEFHVSVQSVPYCDIDELAHWHPINQNSNNTKYTVMYMYSCSNITLSVS